MTTPANALISRITERMPAILPREASPIWLGDTDASLAQVKAVLTTFEDRGTWAMTEQPSCTRSSRERVIRRRICSELTSRPGPLPHAAQPSADINDHGRCPAGCRVGRAIDPDPLREGGSNRRRDEAAAHRIDMGVATSALLRVIEPLRAVFRTPQIEVHHRGPFKI